VSGRVEAVDVEAEIGKTLEKCQWYPKRCPDSEKKYKFLTLLSHTDLCQNSVEDALRAALAEVVATQLRS